MIDMDVVEPAQTDWVTPIVLNPKMDGALRFCANFQKLNAMNMSVKVEVAVDNEMGSSAAELENTVVN